MHLILLSIISNLSYSIFFAWTGRSKYFKVYYYYYHHYYHYQQYYLYYHHQYLVFLVSDLFLLIYILSSNTRLIDYNLITKSLTQQRQDESCEMCSILTRPKHYRTTNHITHHTPPWHWRNGREEGKGEGGESRWRDRGNQPMRSFVWHDVRRSRLECDRVARMVVVVVVVENLSPEVGWSALVSVCVQSLLSPLHLHYLPAMLLRVSSGYQPKRIQDLGGTLKGIHWLTDWLLPRSWPLPLYSGIMQA